MCGTFSRAPSAIASVPRQETSHAPGNTPSPAVSPSSLRSNSICMPTQTPKRLGRRQRAAPFAQTAASSPRMQSGIAPCPGNTTRSAASISGRIAP
jgi:hypothetical protein